LLLITFGMTYVYADRGCDGDS